MQFVEVSKRFIFESEHIWNDISDYLFISVIIFLCACVYNVFVRAKTEYLTKKKKQEQKSWQSIGFLFNSFERSFFFWLPFDSTIYLKISRI